MYRGRTLVVVLFWTALAIFHKTVDAGPTIRSRRIAREIYPPDVEPESDGNQPQVCIVGDVVYGVDETVPAEQPCLKCRCQPPGVQCETIRCTKKPGCKAIHRPNSCCPDYQCECQHNGNTYANGEKLETTLGGECKVCYCRGGEIQCAEVTCYIRKDCEGKRVPGTCCPKYDHCPPIDALLEGAQYTTELTMTNVDQQTLEVLPLPSITQTTNETFLGQTTNEIHDDEKSVNKQFEEQLTLELANNHKLLQNGQSEVEDLQKPIDNMSEPKITIQEIIPEIKEIPITASPKSDDNPQTQGQLIIEEAKDHEDAKDNDLVVTDAEPDSSEISEVFQQPPPVLRIGDKLLFLKKGELIPEKDTSTPTSVITIIGAEGLQRGFEESAETHDESDQQRFPETDGEATNLTDSNDLELKTSESSHILSLVKKKNNVETTTTTTEQPSSTTQELSTSEATTTAGTTTTTITSSIESIISTTEAAVTSDAPESLTTTTDSHINIPTSTEGKPSSSTDLPTESSKLDVPEQNPEYPPIPEIMIIPEEIGHTDDSSHRFDNDFDKVNITEDIIEMKILPEILDIRNNKTVPENTTHSEWLKNDSMTQPGGVEDFKAVASEDGLSETTTEEVTETTVESTTGTTTETLETTSVKLNEKIELTTEKIDTTTETTTIKGTSIINRSVETVEESTEESGEKTTERYNNHSPLKSDENISLENETTELKDMLKETKSVDNTGSVEATTVNIANDVEFIGEIHKTDDPIKPGINKDVEIIKTPPKPTDAESTTMPEELPKPEKIKLIGKRENNADDEAAEVFKQLDRELNAENTERTMTPEEEQKEADEIFKELLEETSTPKAPPAPQGRNKDSDTLQRVSDALAKFTLRGNQPDRNILGILSNFFSSQYKYKK